MRKLFLGFFILCLFIGVLALFSFPVISPRVSSSPSFDPRLASPVSLPPSVSFGDILSGSYQSSSSLTRSSDISDEKVRAFISRLTASSLESREHLAAFLPPVTPTPRDLYALDSASSSHARIPTLIAGISALVDAQSRLDSQPAAYPTLPLFSFSPPLSSSDNIGNLTTNPFDSVYRIAVLGDSMVETLGQNLTDLRGILETAYPNDTFALFNYGQGATDIEHGLMLLTNQSTYQNVSYAPILSHQPDILVVESFAYNHWSGSLTDLDRQWLTIGRIIQTTREQSPGTRIILATTIAPDSQTVGDGLLNWSTQEKWDWAQTTKAYLVNMIRFATSQHYPLADAYSASVGPDGRGIAQYINPVDHLHPSSDGARLFSQKIADVIRENHFVR